MLAAGSPVTVTAPVGEIVGRLENGVRRFLGIPYAEAPLRELRFAAPVARAPFTEPFDAGAAGATSQRHPLFAVTTIPEPSIPGDDILTVSIVAPERIDRALPVLVWVHGGGFVAGSPASPWYDGRSFARDGIITVSVGYRLGIDGFGSLAGVPSNLGLRDVLLALSWVQHNIAAFGGDATRVTLAGQSAGGGIALAVLSSPAAVGLFSAAVSISGVDFLLEASRVAAVVAAVAEHLGVSATRAGLAAVSDGTLQRAVIELRTTSSDDLLTLGPILDGDLLTAPIGDGLRSVGHDIPLLLGSTADEFDGGPTPENPTPQVLSAEERIHARSSGTRVTDLLFRSVVPRVAAARAQAAAGTWSYTFDWLSPVSDSATHCADLPFFFDLLEDPAVPPVLGDEPPHSLASAMHGDLVAFVSHGTLAWPRATGRHAEASRRYGAGVSGTVDIVYGAYDPVLQPPDGSPAEEAADARR